MSKNLNDEYLNMLNEDLPDLWGRISAALPPKASFGNTPQSASTAGVLSGSAGNAPQSAYTAGTARKAPVSVSEYRGKKKKKVPVYRIAGIAAACAAAAIGITAAVIAMNAQHHVKSEMTAAVSVSSDLPGSYEAVNASETAKSSGMAGGAAQSDGYYQEQAETPQAEAAPEMPWGQAETKAESTSNQAEIKADSAWSPAEAAEDIEMIPQESAAAQGPMEETGTESLPEGTGSETIPEETQSTSGQTPTGGIPGGAEAVVLSNVQFRIDAVTVASAEDVQLEVTVLADTADGMLKAGDHITVHADTLLPEAQRALLQEGTDLTKNLKLTAAEDGISRYELIWNE